MDPITQQQALAAAGAAGGEGLYVDDVFSTYLYEGTGTTQTITNGIDLAGEGGLVWQKNRQSSSDHRLQDTERGLGNTLFSSTTAAQASEPTLITSANSDGFTLGGYLGTSNIASWTFRKAPGFFDVVTYTGNDVAGREIAHNLGSVPGMIIVKCTTASTQWPIYHRSLGEGQYLFLDDTSSKSTYDSGSSNSRYWNNTAPTSTGFTVSNDGWVNVSGKSYVAYLFAHDDQSFGTNGDESIIKCGSYTGNGSTQEIDLGWEPQWVLIKSSAGTTTNWHVFDNMRGINAAGNDSALFADNTNVENSSNDYFGQLTATGFKLTSTLNGSGKTYIYMAIRRPHKPPEAGTEVFAAQATRAATDGTPSSLAYTSNFPVDMVLNLCRASNSAAHPVVNRLAGGDKFLRTTGTNAEASTVYGFDTNEGVYLTATFSATSDNGGLLFKRAPGFFDVVAYEGTGSAQTVDHNLTVAPELIIGKCRNTASTTWLSYHNSLGSTKFIELNSANAAATASTVWNNTDPTSSVFTVGTSSGINASGRTYVAYLFATLDGISKVGSYTGNGTAQTIDCGFTNGARFILIKQTDGINDWRVFDSARGYGVGNDLVLSLNTTAGEDPNKDWLEADSSGFRLNTADDNVNGLNKSYIFLAIA